MCPRMAKAADGAETPAQQPRVGLYDAARVKTILTVGDGNFSYSLALARALGPDAGVTLLATSHESNQTVLDTYPDGEQILAELNAMPHVTVQHEVDATDADQIKQLGLFDRVIWNFPCVRAPRGEDGQNQEMEMNKQLLHGFFAHVGQMLTPSGEVHVTHKTKAPFGQWGIEDIAKTNKLRHEQSVIFDRCLYPGYSNKKVLSKGSFPIWDSQTFIFVPEDRASPEMPAEGDDVTTSDGKEGSAPIEPVTMDILKKVYLLLTPSLDDMLGTRKKRKGFNKGPKIVSNKEADSSNKDSNKADKSKNKVGNNKRKHGATGHMKGGKQSGRKKSRRS
ncbi:unnamed protein product [Phytophthora fragariaefolia]|uniref:Unnamed protein product n=1 Tax=Phytophthora fragariaefolia TaxID=1490495 RepID=A0A9W6Y1L7_9STRA|nr:unnamed protein product [Phytophthora fragariaefolia]